MGHARAANERVFALWQLFPYRNQRYVIKCACDLQTPTVLAGVLMCR
jgi:hypothetical protein